ncbi:MAG: LysM peptidoglycan-binding domain-containing protein [Fermentimonas sp.]|nr:LysM peptidoglycan-binding domain-containing protein [Fermentimonas sp.]
MIRNILFTTIFLFVCFASIANTHLVFHKALISDSTNQRGNVKTKAVIKDIISDDAIVYPESMSEKLSDLLGAWQLELSAVNLECMRGQNITYHDTVYANKLYSIPSVMELSYNQVVKTYIEMYSTRRREQVSYMLALGEYYFPMFEEALDRHGLPLELKYLPVIESALNPIAVSRVGATGLWQFMLKTGKSYGLEVNSLVDERRDPYKSTEAAVRYLKDLYTIYGDWNLVIAAYNCGPGNVNKAIARSGGKRDYWEIYYRLPKETRGYVPAFIAANYIMNHFADHNICPAHNSGSSLTLDTINVSEQIHLEQISGVLNIPLSEIKRLNPQFKSDRIPGNIKSYSLVLPSDKMFAYIDRNDSIINYNRKSYFTHRTYTHGYMDGTNSLNDGNTTDIYYSVRRGDNLSSIARRNGTTISLIKSWNNLNSDRLSVGKKLIVGKKAVPLQKVADDVSLAQAKSGGSNRTVNTYYRVKKGDTLGDIAQKNSINLTQLRSWNGLKSTRINIGDQLIVKQEVVHEPIVDNKESDEDISPVSSEKGSNIISEYIKEQMSKSAESRIDSIKDNNTEEL